MLTTRAFAGALAIAAAAALGACGGGGGGGGGGTTPPAPANMAPTVTIATPVANASVAAGAAVRIAATAADSDGTVAKVEFYDGSTKLGEVATAPFEFVWAQPAAGAHTITARATDNAGAVALSGSVTITVEAPPPSPPSPPPPNQAPTVTITAPGSGFKADAPATFTLAANAADADGRIAKVEFFKIDPTAPVLDAGTRLGEATAVGTPPAYQLQTTQGAGTHTFVARATDNGGATGTSASVQVVVNAPPAVSLVSPQPGATVAPGATLTLRAQARDADGSIAKLEFVLNGTTVLGTGAQVGGTDEYTLAWSTTAQGAYSFAARATDNDGAVQTTASVAVNVPANVLPTIALDVPVAGANAPTTLALAASATDADGNVLTVEFFNGSTSLGFGTLDAASGKYRRSVPIAASQAGTYTLTARATDNLGAQSTTASRSVTIAPNLPPAVALTSPANFMLPTAVVLAASAADSDGIVKVEFFSGTVKLGESAAAPYQFTWPGAAVGTYSITARATDGVGSVATSAVQTVTVATPALVMSCADGAATQCSGDAVLRIDNGVGLMRSGVQVYGRSTSDFLPVNPNVSTAKGFTLASGGVAELRVRKDAAGTPTSVAMLLEGFGISWNGAVQRPRIIETFNPTAGRLQLDGNGALLNLALPPSTDLAFYDFATLGPGATAARYANNRYFPRALPIRCTVGQFCATEETTGLKLSAGDWHTGGTEADLVSATRFHEDGDVHAGNGLPDANGNPTLLPGANGFGVPMPGSKGTREVRHWSFRYANLASWFTQDTVNIAEWGGQDEHSTNRRGFVAYGEVTAPATVPSVGGATYVGDVRGEYVTSASVEPVLVKGLVTVFVDFGARTVSISFSGTVSDEPVSVALPLGLNSTATLRASGEANVFGGPANTSALAGGIGGRLFGPLSTGPTGLVPPEVAGTFSMTSPSTGAAFIGGFIAQRR